MHTLLSRKNIAIAVPVLTCIAILTMTSLASANEALGTNNPYQDAYNANTSQTGFFNQVFTVTNSQAGNWFNRSINWAVVIFSGLIGLELTWSVVEAYLQKSDLNGLFGSIFQRILFSCFGVAILMTAPSIVPKATEDFVTLGVSIAGGDIPGSNMMGWKGTHIDIDGVLGSGQAITNVFYKKYIAIEESSKRNDIKPDLQAACFVIDIGFVFLALQLLLATFQTMITVAGGAFLLGFVGSRWTLPWAQMYPKMIIDSGIKLVSISLILAVGNKLVLSWIDAAQNSPLNPMTLNSITFSTLLFSLLGWFLPGAVQGLTNNASFGQGLGQTLKDPKHFSSSGGGGSAGGGGGHSGGGSAGSGGGSSATEAMTKAAEKH